MAPVVIFPDATKAIIPWLESTLTARGTPAPVHQAIPTPRPARFVVVYGAGGAEQSLVSDRQMVTVDAWESRADRASTLAQLCRGLVKSLRGTVTGGVTFYRVVDIAAPVPLPDEDSDQPRYRFTVEARVRGVAG